MKRGKKFLILLLLFVAAHIAGFWAGRIIHPTPAGEVINWAYSGTVQNVEREGNGGVTVELYLNSQETLKIIHVQKDAYRLGERDVTDLEAGEFISMDVSLVEYVPEPVCIAYCLE